jgi:hypothetical protein
MTYQVANLYGDGGPAGLTRVGPLALDEAAVPGQHRWTLQPSVAPPLESVSANFESALPGMAATSY